MGVDPRCFFFLPGAGAGGTHFEMTSPPPQKKNLTKKDGGEKKAQPNIYKRLKTITLTVPSPLNPIALLHITHLYMPMLMFFFFFYGHKLFAGGGGGGMNPPSLPQIRQLIRYNFVAFPCTVAGNLWVI